MIRRRVARLTTLKAPNRKVILAAFVLIALYQIVGIALADVWADEAFSWFAATRTGFFEVAGSALVVTDVHPPLYLILLNGWIGLVGETVIALRMLSVLLMWLTFPAVYLLGRRLLHDRIGFYAMCIMGVMPFTVFYAQEARQYALSVCAFMWASYGLVEMLKGGPAAQRRGMIVYVIGASMALYSLYFCGLALVAINLWAVVSGATFCRWRSWGLTNLVIAVAFLPQASTFLAQTRDVLTSYWPQPPDLFSIPLTIEHLMYVYSLTDETTRIVAMVMTVLALVFCLYDTVRRGPKSARGALGLCLIGLFGPMIAVLLISNLRASVYVFRSFAMIAPFWVLILAAGLGYARRPSPTPLFVLALVVIMFLGREVIATTPTLFKPPYREAVQAMQRANAQAPLLHLHNSAILPMHYYAPEKLGRTVVADTGDRVWITTPEVWNLLPVQRLTFAATLTWAQAQSEPFFIVMPKGTAPREKALFAQLVTRCRQIDQAEYGRELTVYTVTCRQ
jgi:uncharacterized membrane protein